MKKCNCKATYEPQKERYVISLSMVKKGFDVLDMLWDTGACNSVIYSNLLRDIKNIDKYQYDELERTLNYSEKGRSKSQYIRALFDTVSNKNIHGILCCAHNIYISHLHLENFYFFMLPANEKKTRGLLGADFISCCKRQCDTVSDEIFTQFDEELYEQKYQKLLGDKGKLPYNLNLLMKAEKKFDLCTDLTHMTVF